MGFFFDFLTAWRGDTCGDGVGEEQGDGLIWAANGVPGKSGAGNEGGLRDIFQEGGYNVMTMVLLPAVTLNTGEDFIRQFPRFLVFLSFKCMEENGVS